MATAESSEIGKSRSGKEKIDEEESNDKITFRNTPEFRKDFILSCLEEVNDSGSVGSSLKQQSWERMGSKLAEKYKCPMPYKKLRNHWDYLKNQHIVWTKLLSITGHGYNSETKKFDWTEEQWTDISKRVKNARQFKEKGLEDADLLKCIFDGKFPNGGIKWTPGQPREITTEPQSTSTSATNTVDLDPPVVDEVQDTSASNENEKKRKRVETASDKMNEKVEYLVGILEKDVGAPAQFIKVLDDLKNAGHITFDDYLEVGFKASELTGWQKLFINLPTVEHQVSYVKKLLGQR